MATRKAAPCEPRRILGRFNKNRVAAARATVDPTEPSGEFCTTNWSLVISARESEDDLRELLSRYWSPVYAFYRRLGESRDQAADLTQAFLTKVLADRELLLRASPQRGRFRRFLAASLRNFRIDELRKIIGRRGERARVFLPADEERWRNAEPDESDDPAQAFDRQWAATVLSETVTRLEKICRGGQLDQHWAVFESRLVRPLLSGAAPIAMEQLVEELGLDGPDDVSHMLFTVKRKFRRTLHEVIAETVSDPSDVEDEVADVQRVLRAR